MPERKTKADTTLKKSIITTQHHNNLTNICTYTYMKHIFFLNFSAHINVLYHLFENLPPFYVWNMKMKEQIEEK
jgi:hypothetical protein